jgi:tetratricopeptide (TPR) repeat protein
LKPGKELLWYRIKGLSAVRNFSISYLCEDLNLQRQVILLEYFPRQSARRNKDEKLCPTAESSLDSLNQGIERFVSVAETLASLQHPQVEKVLDVFEANNTAYAVLPQHHVKHLDDLLRREKTLPEARLLKILLPLLDGVERLFQRGLRDLGLTPSNILISPEGEPFLSSVDLINHAAANSADVLALPSEIYRLGSLAYRAVTGVFPPSEQARLEAQVRDNTDPYASATLRAEPGYSQRLLNAIDLALRLPPEERPGSIAAWRQAIEFHESTKEWSISELFPGPEKLPAIHTEPGIDDETRNPLPWQLHSREEDEKQAGAEPQPSALPHPASMAEGNLSAWRRHPGHQLALAFLAIFACVGVYTVSSAIISSLWTDYVPSSAQTPSVLSEPGPLDQNAPAIPVLPEATGQDADTSITQGPPAPVDELIRLAEDAMQQGQWDEAETHLAKAASINPDSARLADVWKTLDAHRAETHKQVQLAKQEVEKNQAERKVNELLDKARRAMDQKDWDSARSLLSQTEKILPDFETVAEVREELKQRRKPEREPEDQSKMEITAVQDEGKSVQGYIDDALRAMERTDWGNAQRNLDQASALDPRNEDIALLRAELASRREQAWIDQDDKTKRGGGLQNNPLVHIQKASSSVAKARPGQTVEFVTEYAMSTPMGQKYEYVEVTWVLKRHGKKVGDEGMSATVVKPGVNSVSNHLTLPERVTPGRYEVEHRVRAGDSVDIATSGFLVMAH